MYVHSCLVILVSVSVHVLRTMCQFSLLLFVHVYVCVRTSKGMVVHAQDFVPSAPKQIPMYVLESIAYWLITPLEPKLSFFKFKFLI